jgi:glycosyltransferase involved in cell wall biosynthesis
LFVIKALGTGGAERVFTEVCANLAESGHEIRVVTFDSPGTRPFYPLPTTIDFIPLGIGDSARPTGLIELMKRSVSLRRQLKEFRPVALVAFMHSSYVPAALASVRTNVPIVASEHIVFDHYAKRPIDRVMIRLCTPALTAITAVSETMRATFPEIMRRKMVVIPNPVTPAFSNRPDLDESRTILAVGRLEEQKDHRTLIAAFASVAQDYPDWRVRIVGEGRLRTKLQRQIDGLRLGDRIELPGLIADIAAEYEQAGIFVMPSRYESFGLATAEALAHGVPAVGFDDCAGTNELIRNDKNGLLLNGQDRIGALASGLRQLMDSSDLRRRLGAAGPQSVRFLSKAAVAAEWEALLQQVAQSRS